MQETKQRKKHGNDRKLFRLKFPEWIGKRRVNRQVKDTLFRFLFEKDKEALLQLYNALNGTDYQDAEKLQIVTIENAVYIVMKNDLAFIIAGTMNLYEHQSTYNPNMPVRFLIYLAEEYQKVIAQAKKSIYGMTQISLPTPQCIVFYNGEKEIPEEQVLKLSDAFENKKQQADVELTVRMYNINYGHNKELLEKCKALEAYARFVAIVREYLAEEKDRQEALNKAIDYCIDHDILSELLRKYRGEVLGMLLEEFDVDKYERTIRAEGHEEGYEKGREEGIRQGAEQETKRSNQLTALLLQQNRIGDLKRSTEDAEYRERLFREFRL